MELLEIEHCVGYSPLRGGLHYHPNGKEYVYAAGASVIVSDLEDPHAQAFLRGHDDMITCIALAPDGKHIASGQRGDNADAILWCYEKKELKFRFSEHDHEVVALAFSHDGLLLCTAGGVDDGKLMIWDVTTGCIVTTAHLDPNPTTCISWGGHVKDSKRRDIKDRYQLCCAGGTQPFVLYDIDPYTGEMETAKIPHVRNVTWVTFSSNHDTIYGATTSGDLLVVNVRSKRVVSGTAEQKKNREIFASRSGLDAVLVFPQQRIVAGDGDGAVTLINDDLRDVAQVVLPGAVVAMSLAPDASEFIVGLRTGAIYRVRADLEKALLVAENHARAVVSVAYAPGTSDAFATASLDKTIRVWDANDYSCSRTVLVRDAGDPTCLVFTFDFLISGWTDGKIRAYDASDDDQQPLWLVDDAHRNGVTALLLAPNSRFLVSGGDDGDVRVWDIATRRLVSHLKEHRSRVTGLALYDDGHHALSCSRDRSFLCWDLKMEKRLTSHAQRMGGINAIALSKDQTSVFSVGQEKRLTRWDLRDPLFLEQSDLDPVGMTDEANAVAVSNGGHFVATGGTQKQLKLFEAKQGHRLLSTISGHSAPIADLKFSPDDKQLVTVGHDGLIFVINLFSPSSSS